MSAPLGLARKGFVLDRVEPLLDPAAQSVQLALVQQLTAQSYRPPVLPAVAVQLVELSERPNVTTHEIATLIEQDPVLAADMLRVSKSALLSLSSPIHTVGEALVRLGIRRSTELFVQAALKSKLFRCRGYENVLERLRRHSVATAEISRHICQLTKVCAETYLVGLLHDVGIAGCVLALASKARPTMLPPFASAWPAIRGIHQRFALHLAASWQLPKELRAMLMAHYAFEATTEQAEVAAVTVLAEWIANTVGHGFEDEFQERVGERAAQILGLSEPQLQQLTAHAKELTARLD